METEAEGRKRGSLEWPEVVFFGTPAFAVPSLEMLAARGVPLKLVVTQPDRPSGRGKKLTPPPVKTLAQRLGVPVFQAERLRAESSVRTLADFGGDCALVVAYGQLLPQSVLDLYPRGVLNIHGSLLPRLRGSAPIQRTLLNGDLETGITIMLLDAGMDTGPVLRQRRLDVAETETFGSLHDRLALAGAECLLETLALYHSGSLSPKPQDDSAATYAPPIGKEELRIDWGRPARQLVNAIRAFDPMPGAFAYLEGRRIKCFRAAVHPLRATGQQGEILGVGETGLVVLAGDGRALSIGELQLEGQRRLPAGAFLRGRAGLVGSRLN